MKGMILAAGFGERLRPITKELPKPLVPLANIPIIKYNLYLLKKSGISEVIINLHYKAQDIINEIGNGKDIDMKIEYSYEASLLGTGGGIKKAQSFLGKDTCLVINCDILIDFDLNKCIEFHKRNNGIVTMILIDGGEEILVDSKGIVIDILSLLGKNKSSFRGGKFTGIHIIEPSILKDIEENRFLCINRDIYTSLISKGERIFGYFVDGYFMDIGTVDRYYKSNMDILNGKVKIPFDIEVKDSLIVGRDCKIAKGAKIKNRVILGDNVSVEEGAVIENSIIWKEARIGPYEKIKGMIVTKSLNKIKVLT
jgi:NDP-sugar pyrophosphorylase family protein